MAGPIRVAIAGAASEPAYALIFRVAAGGLFGFPLRTNDGRSWSIVRDQYLDRFALDRLAANVAELQHEASVAAAFL